MVRHPESPANGGHVVGQVEEHVIIHHLPGVSRTREYGVHVRQAGHEKEAPSVDDGGPRRDLDPVGGRHLLDDSASDENGVVLQDPFPVHHQDVRIHEGHLHRLRQGGARHAEAGQQNPQRSCHQPHSPSRASMRARSMSVSPPKCLHHLPEDYSPESLLPGPRLLSEDVQIVPVCNGTGKGTANLLQKLLRGRAPQELMGQNQELGPGPGRDASHLRR